MKQTLAVLAIQLSWFVTAILNPVTAAPVVEAAAQDECTRFAVIGDYGDAGKPAADVADLVKSWNPEFVITTGDNNYPSGEAATIDENIGQYYQEFIQPYKGSFGEGAGTNRFFPVLGNHDWQATDAQPYIDYFTLPHNERYYDFVWGPVHFFAVDSDRREPDGRGDDSVQAEWIREQMLASTARWQIVYLHHPPYTSGVRGVADVMQWPFAEWGADVLLTGHDHFYERLIVDNLLTFINGASGRAPLDEFGTPSRGSRFRFNGDHGAMNVLACPEEITFEFVTRAGAVIESYTLSGGTLSLIEQSYLPFLP